MNFNRGGSSPSDATSALNAERMGRMGRTASTYSRWVKPVLDRFLGLILFLLALPLIAVACVLILVSLGRPVFYSQERVGLNGNTFRLHKLRTMHPDRRESSNGYQGRERRLRHKSPDDPRVTPATKVLRSTRLDELPQFWNVLKGDMSLVGPRPELPEIVSKYEPWQHHRHAVKPGLTGPWQISHRNGKAMHECTQVDLEYLEQISLATDLRILAKTPIAMIGERKGY
jgi:lipopolysaccharide/colanic/teichoic acid biosynthesis glycosyltransferase